MRPLSPLVAALALGLTALAGRPSAQAPSPAELARRIQAHYNTIADFTADFSVTYKYTRFADRAQTSLERGDLKVKKPNRMRWTYVEPDRKEFVADGTYFYQHYPADKYAEKAPLPKADDAPLALMFLAGRGDLTRDFTPWMPAEQPAGEWSLALAPKTRQEDYSTLTLVVRRDSLALAGLVMTDDLGTQTFRFTKFQPNRGLKDSVFSFKPPNGTVIR